jgi:hypothetical protein
MIARPPRLDRCDMRPQAERAIEREDFPFKRNKTLNKPNNRNKSPIFFDVLQCVRTKQ